MEKIASKLMSQVQDFVKKNPKLVTSLAATGGAGALAGALMTGPEDENESGMHRFGRRLQNALLAGGLAAGGTGLALAGMDKIKNALPEDDVPPATAALHSNVVRGLGAVGAGSAGAGIASRNSQKALDSVFGKGNMTKGRLAELLSKYGTPDAAGMDSLNTLSKAWGGKTEAIKNWLANDVGMDLQSIKWDKGVPDSIKQELGGADFEKLTQKVQNTLKRVGLDGKMKKLSPERLAKWINAAKRNKLMLGAGAAGLLLPEAISGTGSAVGSLFGNSLYD